MCRRTQLSHLVHQEFFQLNGWSIFNGSSIHLLKEVVTDVGLILPLNSENLLSTSSTHSQGIIIYLIHTRVHATLPSVDSHMIVLLSLTFIYTNNNHCKISNGRILVLTLHLLHKNIKGILTFNLFTEMGFKRKSPGIQQRY